jgi:hypothetical protein
MFFIHPKCSTPTLGEDIKRSLLGIKAPSSCNVFLESFPIAKRGMWLKKKNIEKMHKCPRYLKQWVLRCLS